MMTHAPTECATKPTRKCPHAAWAAIAGAILIVALIGIRRVTHGCVFVSPWPAWKGGRAGSLRSGVFFWHDGFGWHVRAKSRTPPASSPASSASPAESRAGRGHRSPIFDSLVVEAGARQVFTSTIPARSPDSIRRE